MSVIAAAVLLFVVALSANPARAQAWNADARTVALGGIGGDQNIFMTSVAQARGDRSFVIPFGLIQVLKDRDALNGTSTTFDPARAAEYAANPLHLQFGRTASSPSAAFVSGIRNARLSRDLSDYRGFVPANFSTSGLVTPKWGHVFWLPTQPGRPRHGIYAGAGPHLAINTRLRPDTALVDVLDSDDPRYVANQRFGIDNRTTAQLAAAITGGYRSEFPLAAGGTAAFVSINYSELIGIRYENADLALRLQTDSTGLLTTDSVSALSVTRNYAGRGRGRALDVGVGLTTGRWEAGVSLSNLAHRMTWRNPTERNYTLASLFTGSARFQSTAPIRHDDVRVALPVDYRGNLVFRGERLSFLSEIARQYDHTLYRGGVEHSGRRLQFRVATMLLEGAWYPTAGISLPVSRRLWTDLAWFTTESNIERERRFGLAVSVRITPKVYAPQ